MKISAIEFFDNPDFNIKGGINFNVRNEVGGWRYINIGQRQDKTLYIDADGQRLDQVQDLFDQIIDSATDPEIGTAFEMPRTSSRDYRQNPPEFNKVWIDSIWKPGEHNNGGIDLHWEMKWESGRIELKLSKEGLLIIDGQGCGYEFCKAAFRASLDYHWGKNND